MSFTPAEDRTELYRNAAAHIERGSRPVTPERTPPQREESGQFRSSERSYGQEGLERAAGYKPLKDDDRDEIDSDRTSIRDASNERAKALQEKPIEVHESGLDEKITLSVEQAAKRVEEARKADVDQAELDGTKAAQAEVDRLRGEQPETEPRQPQLSIESEAEFDIAKAPAKVRDAIMSKVAEAETQRQHFETSVKEVGKMRLAALAAESPELMNLPLNQWAAAINNLAKTDLPKARAIATRLHALGEVENTLIQMEKQKTERQQNELRQYSDKENIRFRELTKGMTPQQMAAVQAEVPAMMAEYGVTDPRAFLKAIEGQTFFPRASAERIMIDAARYRLMQKAAKAQPARAVPHVTRPGVVAPRGNSSSTALQALNQKLSQTGDLKDAARLLAAKRKATKR
jgi:hypothetical protein